MFSKFGDGSCAFEKVRKLFRECSRRRRIRSRVFCTGGFPPRTRERVGLASRKRSVSTQAEPASWPVLPESACLRRKERCTRARGFPALNFFSLFPEGLLSAIKKVGVIGESWHDSGVLVQKIECGRQYRRTDAIQLGVGRIR